MFTCISKIRDNEFNPPHSTTMEVVWNIFRCFEFFIRKLIISRSRESFVARINEKIVNDRNIVRMYRNDLKELDHIECRSRKAYG